MMYILSRMLYKQLLQIVYYHLKTKFKILLKIINYGNGVDIRFMSWERLFACSISNIP